MIEAKKQLSKTDMKIVSYDALYEENKKALSKAKFHIKLKYKNMFPFFLL